MRYSIVASLLGLSAVVNGLTDGLKPRYNKLGQRAIGLYYEVDITLSLANSLLDAISTTISDEEWENFHYFAQYAGSAYCDANDDANTTTSSEVTCDSVCPDVEESGATIVLEFDTVLTDTRGYVAYDPTYNLVVVSFRGTSSTLNWIDDLNFIFTDCDWLTDGCEVHEGFYEAWEAVQDEVVSTVDTELAKYTDATLIVTGHSLGAAIATIAGAYLRVEGYPNEIWNYGCPRVFNPTGAEYVSNQDGGVYRMTHYRDEVPQVPPIWVGFAHTSPEFWLADGTDTTLNYNISDVVTCTGYQNTSCNAGTSGDTTSHDYYLVHIDDC